MKIVRSKPTPVVMGENLPQRDGKPWCEDHGESFKTCICPKQISTADTDGWYVEDTMGRLTAYPTEELYNELALWIDKKNDSMICTRCGESLPVGKYYSEAETSDLVESFYEIHYGCDAQNGS